MYLLTCFAADTFCNIDTSQKEIRHILQPGWLCETESFISPFTYNTHKKRHWSASHEFACNLNCIKILDEHR